MKNTLYTSLFLIATIFGFTPELSAHAQQIGWCMDCATGDLTIWIEHNQGAGASTASAGMTFELNVNGTITNFNGIPASTSVVGVPSGGLPQCSSPITIFGGCPLANTTSNWMGYTFPGLQLGVPITITAISGCCSTTSPGCAIFPAASPVVCSVLPCSFTNLAVNVNTCTPNNTYVINGSVDFVNPPATGTLTITDGCSGLDTIINAPFVSPLNWSISGLPTGTGTCDVTAVFSADPACTISLGAANEYPIVAPCNCVADVGTFNTNITPNNGQTPNILCFGDQFTINSNGDNVDPGLANNPPGPAYNPGLGYLIYSCPPTIATVPSNVFPNDNILNDPCFVGVVGFGNSFNDVNFLGGPSFAGPWINNTIYYVPITFYDIVTGTYSYVNTTIPCYEMGQTYAVQYLTEITTVAVEDCQTGSVTVTVSGGLPEADGSLYTASNLLPATASFVNNTTTHGGNIVINGLQDGDMYSFDIVDANGCPATVTGGPFLGLPTANAGVDDTSCTLTYNLGAIPSIGTGTWTGPAGVVFVPVNSPNATVTVPAAGVYNLTWTEDNTSGCIAVDVVTITFNILSIPNTPTNPLCNNGTSGQIILAPQGGVAPYTYQWDAAAGNQITNPSTNLGAGSYMVTVTDAFGCFLDSTFTLTEPLPFTYTTTSVNSNCGNPDGSVTVVGFTGGTAGYTYDWGAGPIASNTQTNLAPGPYLVTVADANGCDTTFTINVLNNPAFTASIIGSINVSCNGLSDGTATAAGSDPLATYTFQWDAAAGNQVTNPATNLGSGTYIVTLTDQFTGCTDTSLVIITEPPLLTVNAGVDDTVCIGLNTNFLATGSGGTPGYTYSWDNGLGAGQNQNVSPGVQTTYIVTVTDANLCTATDNLIASVITLSIPNTPTNPLCNNGTGGQIILAPQGGIAPYTYQWDAAAGNQITNPATNLGAGSYMVTVTDAFGCFLDSTFTLTEPLPFTYTTTSVNSNCSNPDGSATVVGFAGGTPGYTYDWGAGPVPSNSLLNVIPGAYPVTVIDANGCDTTFTINIGNNPTFTASILSFTNASCEDVSDGTATATGSDPLATYTYQWDAATGNQVTNPAINLGAGTYVVTVTDQFTGCTDTASITIIEPPLLTVNAGLDAAICFGGNTNLSANGAGGTPGYTYSWDNGLGAGQNQNVSPGVQTIYTVTVTDANGCTGIDAVTVTVGPTLLVTASPDDSICPGDQINISASVNPAGPGNGIPYAYSWDNGLGAGQNQTVSPAVTTTYIVTLSDGCTFPNATDSVTIFVKPLPNIDFLADTLGLCETPQQAFTFTNTTTPVGGTITWTFGDGNGASGDIVSHTYAGPGSYDVGLTVTGTNGCTAGPVVKTNYVSVFANPVADFTMNPDPADMFDPTVNFNDQSYNNIVNWSWDIGGLDSSNMQNPIYTFPADTGTYLVILTVIDANGCVDTTSNTAIVIGEFGIYVPNSFTPDGDGMNDGFFPSGFGINNEDYTFMIFDRWGEVIFESHRKFAPWNGTYKGAIVQNGVYVWKLIFKDINGQTHTKLGRVTILK